VQAIARGDGKGGPAGAAAHASARRMLNDYIDDVARLKGRGVISDVSAAELTTSAQEVLALLP
jgi:hypothetical protein